MKIKKTHWIGIIFAVAIMAVNFIFFIGDRLFFFLFGISILVLILPFLISIIVVGGFEKEKNRQFLEFSRNLAESVKTGTPIGKSIINMKEKDFGSLSPYVGKLANQISLGVPISKAFQTFAYEVESETIRRAISLIREAENAGGEITYILDSVAESMYEIDRLKKERQTAISGLVVQGYIIFFIFIGIMLVMEFKVLPLTTDIGTIGPISGGFNTGSIESASAASSEGSALQVEQLTRPFLYLLLVQGIFTGLTIGKLSEGAIKFGIKHSVILAAVAFIVTSGARIFL